MVIQRNWKTANNNSTITENLQHTTSSSEDSNSSWHTLSNSTSSSHTKNVNYSKTSISNPQMAESVLKALKYRYNGRSHANQTNTEGALMSLELMRMNVQDEFNKEIDVIVRKYIDNFFRPALKNVKENLGENSISTDCLQKMSCNLLDNAKSQYMSHTSCSFDHNNQNKPTVITATSMEHINRQLTINPIENEQENTIQFTQQSNIVGVKRKEPSSDNNTTTPFENQEQATISAAKRLQTNVQLKTIGRTKQIFWNVSYLNIDTLFVLDFKANRILGFAENSKERLASKHPELIRYLPDANDKDWMLQQKILTPATRNCRILLLVYDEVCKIAQSDEYRKNSSIIKLSDLDGFKVPEFILQKMKIFFTELSLRSQSFLMNSSLTQQSTTTSCSTIVTSVAATTVTTTTEQSFLSSSASSSINVTSSGQNAITIAIESSMKPKSSLSSTHATLKALLSSTIESSGTAIIDGLTNITTKKG